VLLICNVAAICTVAYTKGYRHLVQLRKQHSAASADAEQLAVSAISDIAVLAAVVAAAAALAAAASGLWVSPVSIQMQKVTKNQYWLMACSRLPTSEQ
jgi:hypothetical protein